MSLAICSPSRTPANETLSHYVCEACVCVDLDVDVRVVGEELVDDRP